MKALVMSLRGGEGGGKMTPNVTRGGGGGGGLKNVEKVSRII
jgi:hypothetical protein